MKICAVSDLHGELPEVETCDLVLLGGDLCPGGTFINQLTWLNSVFRNWLENLMHRNIPVVGIAGNHDEIFDDEPGMVPALPWVYLEDSELGTRHKADGWIAPYVNANKLGVRIWGSPWSPVYGNWAFMGDEDFLASRFGGIPDGIDILIVHSPPYGYGDLCPPKITADNECLWPELVHVGSRSLLDAIDRVHPRLVLYGHIHQGRGLYERGDTILCNAASWDHISDTFRPPMYIHLD